MNRRAASLMSPFRVLAGGSSLPAARVVARSRHYAAVLLAGLVACLPLFAISHDAAAQAQPGPAVPLSRGGDKPLLSPPPAATRPPSPMIDLGASRLPPATRDLLARVAPVPHRLYVLASDGRAWSDAWTGSIMLPDVLRDAHLALVTIGSRQTPIHHSYWFRFPDGTLTRHLTAADGRSLGLASVTPVGALQVIVDLDGDRVADFFYESGPGRDTLMLARDAAGAKFLDRFLGSANPFCEPEFAAVRGQSVALPRLADGTPLGRFATCSGDRRASHASPSAAPARDAIDQACAGLARTGAGLGPEAVRDDSGWLGKAALALAGVSKEVAGTVGRWLVEEAFIRGFLSMEAVAGILGTAATVSRWANPVGAFVAVTAEPAKASASPCELRGPGACAADHEARTSGRGASRPADAARAPTAPAPSSAPKSGDAKKDAAPDDGARKAGAPVAGDDGAARGLAALCEARARSAASRPPTSLAELDRRAVKSDCGDPVVNPGPARSATTAATLKCTPEVEAQTLGRAREVFAGSGSGCRPGQRPGPDGTCSGGAGAVVSTGSGGRTGVAFGALVGIEICDPKRCAPPTR